MRRSLFIVALALTFSTTVWAQQASVNFGAISGTVLDEATRLPLSNVTVTVLLSGNGPVKAYKATTEHDGSFEIRRLPLGKFIVAANHDKQVAPIDLDKIETRVELTRESPDKSVTIRLDTSTRP